MTHLAVPLVAPNWTELLAGLNSARQAGATMVELRLDYLAESVLQPARDPRPSAGAMGLPLIVTCRPSWEGGRFAGSEDARRAILSAWAAAIPDAWIDVEWRALTRQPWPCWESLCRRAILSFHDFERTPTDLPATLNRMAELRPAKLKIATLTSDVLDSLRLLRLLAVPPVLGQVRYAASDLIVLGMGEAGVLTRVLAPKFGAFLSFAALRPAAQSAPGQLSIADMLGQYRWQHIHPGTSVYGLFGWPVGHSLSPAIHNAGFTQIAHDGVYVPMPVRPDQFPEAMSRLEDFAASTPEPAHGVDLKLLGASVTIPHKESAFALAGPGFAEVADGLGRRAGAINTLYRDSSRAPWQRANTDVLAVRKLLSGLATDSRLGAEPVLILGAGGVARGVLAALETLGFAGAMMTVVRVANRDPTRAKSLADEFGVTAVPWEHRAELGQLGLVVNCTSVGMTPNTDVSPLPAEALAPTTVVFDTVYNPPRTRLLREAGALGCRVITGVDMFLEQAVAQFELWTGQAAPRATMAAVLQSRLGQPRE